MAGTVTAQREIERGRTKVYLEFLYTRLVVIAQRCQVASQNENTHTHTQRAA